MNYREYILEIKKKYRKVESIGDLIEHDWKKCVKCELWLGNKKKCIECENYYHYVCEEFNKRCLECKKNNDEISECSDDDEIIIKYNIINEKNEKQKNSLLNLIDGYKRKFTDDLIYENTKIEKLNDIDEVFTYDEIEIEIYKKMKENSRQGYYGGINIEENELIANRIIQKNTLICEWSGLVCTKSGDKKGLDLVVSSRKENNLIINNDEWVNLNILFRSKEKGNCELRIFNIESQLRLIVISNKKILKGERLILTNNFTNPLA
jgi:hypothetical protein